MLIFDEKMMIFEAFLGPIHIPGTCFLHVFSRFFSTRKSLVTILVQSIRIAILVQICFCKKVSFFLFMKKLMNAKILNNAYVFRDFLCFFANKLKK